MRARWCVSCVILVLCCTAVWATATHTTGLHAVPAPAAMTIDGSLAEWDLSGRVLICSDLQTLRESYSAQIALMYDADNLYVALQWKDPSPMGNRNDPHTDAPGWAGDCLQLRLRTDHIVSVTAWYYTPDQEPVIQLDFGKGDYPFGGGIRKLKRVKGWELQEGAAMAFQPDADGKGYVQELKLPWALLAEKTRYQPGAQLTCGVDLLWGDDNGIAVRRHTADNAKPDFPPADENIFCFCPTDWGPVVLEPAGHLRLPPPAWTTLVDQGKPLAITLFRGGAEAAISFTFDDGSENQFAIAAPILNEFKVKGTFFVVTGVIRDKKTDPMPPGAYHYGNGGMSWEELRQLAAMGHEIGSHSMTHLSLVDTDAAALEREVNGSAKLIAEKLGQAPVSFCYPGNARDGISRAAVLQWYIADRSICFSYGGDPATFTLATANRYVDNALAEHTWMVTMIHGIEEGYSPLDRETLRRHLAYIRQLGNRVWVETFGNIARYRKERDTALLRIVSRREKAITFTLTTPLDASLYNVPLTISIPTPDHRASNVRVQRKHGAPLPVQVRDNLLLVDVLPGAEPVTVKWR